MVVALEPARRCLMTLRPNPRGSRVRWRGRTPKRMAAGRVCVESSCTAKLSTYNNRDTCSLHGQIRFPRTRGQTKATDPTPL